MLNEILNRTNESGKAFIKMWLRNVELLGIEDNKGTRKEFFVIYKRVDNEIRVACLPELGSTNEPCFFGSLNHYATVVAQQTAVVTGRLCNTSIFLLPNKTQRKMAIDTYNRIIKQYKEISNGRKRV